MIQIFFRIFALLALVLMVPVLLLIGLILWFAQGSPVIFRQQRSGLHMKPFWLVKFRSMHNWRDDRGELLPDAQRTSKVGNFLRITRLDELPGLWNMVTGNVALIGPRPLLPVTINGLGTLGEKRSSIRPGITGWAQINGNTLLSLDQKVALDIWYIENRSVRLDIWILYKTFWVALGGERVNAGALNEAHIADDDLAV